VLIAELRPSLELIVSMLKGVSPKSILDIREELYNK